MNRTKKLLPLLVLCLALAACGPKEPSPAVTTSSPSSASSQPEADHSVPDTSEPDTSEPSLPPPLSAEEIADAQSAAHAYYENTVFEVHTLTEIAVREGEITFQVSCSKGGVPQDPDRTISLERQDGVWTVLNEGY